MIREKEVHQLPLVLDLSSGANYFVYQPSLDARGSKTAADRRVISAALRNLRRHKRVKGGIVKPGDHVYVLRKHFVTMETGPRTINQGYYRNAYLHQVVEHDGRLWFKTLARTPAAPAASGSWLEPGTLTPIPKNELCYRVKKSVQSTER